MGQNCDDSHICEPEWYPQSLDEIWACPECGNILIAVNVRDQLLKMNLTEETRRSMMSTVKSDSLGWSSARVRETP